MNQSIAELRARYYALATSKFSLLNLILDNEVAEQVYNSNAIEKLYIDPRGYRKDSVSD